MNKKVLLGLGVCVLLFLMVAGASLAKYLSEQAKIVKEVDRNLSQEDQQIYQDRISAADQQLGEATEDQVKYNLYMTKGFNLYGLGKLAESVKNFKEASDLKPEDANAYVAMYTSRLEMNDLRRARADIQKALELNPQSADIWKKYIVMEKERFGTSMERLNEIYLEAVRATQGGPTYVDIVTSYATFLEEKGDLNIAKSYWEQAITLNPDGREIYLAEMARLDGKIQQGN